jgi:hypothetical protein
MYVLDLDSSLPIVMWRRHIQLQSKWAIVEYKASSWIYTLEAPSFIFIRLYNVSKEKWNKEGHDCRTMINGCFD